MSFSIREEPLWFDCEDAKLVGVLTHPDAPARTGVLIVVGGPQYRVGSHRQFVHLARRIGGTGLPCLRFDYRGMGDSEGTLRTFEAVDADIGAAVDALQRASAIERVVLWGLCDGATAALMYARHDARIAGIVAVNPWAKTSAGEASVRLKHYYVRRLGSPQFWRKLVSGNVSLRTSARGAVHSVRSVLRRSPPAVENDYLARMHYNLVNLRHALLLVLSGDDLTAREFDRWLQLDRDRRLIENDPRVEVDRIDAADHTFSNEAARRNLENVTIHWIQRRCAAEVERVTRAPI
jgi:exosortase A-associated hydrolase 1